MIEQLGHRRIDQIARFLSLQQLIIERLRFESAVPSEQFLIDVGPELLQRSRGVFALNDALNLVASQTSNPGEGVVLGAGRVVMTQLAQGTQHRLLDDILAPVSILADAIHTKTVER